MPFWYVFSTLFYFGTTVDNLTSGEANYILGKNGSTYERVGGFDVVVELENTNNLGDVALIAST